MARPIRRSRSALIEHLFAHPRAYTFFQAIRLLERAEALRADTEGREPPEPIGFGADPKRAAVVIQSNVPLAFAGAEITALARSARQRPELTQTVIGLTGATGALPHVFSDMVQASVREREFGLRAFLDLFNGRIAGLFYSAWAKHRLTIETERATLPGARTPVDAFLKALIGIGQPSLHERMSLPDATPIHFGGLLSRTGRSAQAVGQILAGAFGYPVNVEQFYGAWLPLASADQSRLARRDRPDGTFSRLGSETVAGSRVWDVQSAVCLVIGPLGYRDFLAFLPDGPMNRRLVDLATFALGPEFTIHTRLLLAPEEVPPLRLGGDPRITPDGRLGRNTWLGWDGVRAHAGTVEFRPSSPLQ